MTKAQEILDLIEGVDAKEQANQLYQYLMKFEQPKMYDEFIKWFQSKDFSSADRDAIGKEYDKLVGDSKDMPNYAFMKKHGKMPEADTI